jgi:hypothetical protein
LLVAWGREGQGEFLRGDAPPVVGDAQELAPALVDVDPDLGGARVERVFDQLLDGAGGPFDHFPGGDLVDDVRGQHLDLWHQGQP